MAAPRTPYESNGLPVAELRYSRAENPYIVECLKRHSLEGNLRDLLRVANRLIAVLYGSDQLFPTHDAIEYAVLALESSSPTDSAAAQHEKSQLLSTMTDLAIIC